MYKETYNLFIPPKANKVMVDTYRFSAPIQTTAFSMDNFTMGVEDIVPYNIYIQLKEEYTLLLICKAISIRISDGALCRSTDTEYLVSYDDNKNIVFDMFLQNNIYADGMGNYYHSYTVDSIILQAGTKVTDIRYLEIIPNSKL